MIFAVLQTGSATLSVLLEVFCSAWLGNQQIKRCSAVGPWSISTSHDFYQNCSIHQGSVLMQAKSWQRAWRQKHLEQQQGLRRDRHDYQGWGRHWWCRWETCFFYAKAMWQYYSEKYKNHVRENVVFACVCMLNEPAKPLKLWINIFGGAWKLEKTSFRTVLPVH